MPHQLWERVHCASLVSSGTVVVLSVVSAKFGDAIEYYREFVRFCLDSPSDSTAAPLPTLAAVRASPLLTLAAKAAALDAAAGASTRTSSTDASSVSGGIDWGIEVEGAGEATAASIDWDITAEASGEAAPAADAGGIDWGDADGAAATSADGGIDWGIETTESGESAESHAAAAASPSASPDSSSPVATPADSLESDALRQRFLSELLELESFLVERLAEQNAAAGADDLAAAAFSGPHVPHILTLQSAQHTQAYLVTQQLTTRDRMAPPRIFAAGFVAHSLLLCSCVLHV